MSATLCTSNVPAVSNASAVHARTRSAQVNRWWQWLAADSTARGCDPTSSSPEKNRRVLLISYQFPPTGGSGVQRPAKLAKYLPACGWSVEVLAAGHQRFSWTDPSLLDDVPSEVLIHRVAGYEPACLARSIASKISALGSWFISKAGRDAPNGNRGLDQHGRWSSRRIEDALFWRLTSLSVRMGMEGGESLWIAAAVRAALVRHRAQPFDAVISTGPPHVAHRVALHIVRKTGVPWLADIRDPLMSDFDRQQISTRCTRRMRRLERDVLRLADAVVTTCPALAGDLQHRFATQAGMIRAITNGFDRDDIHHAVDPADLLEAQSQRSTTTSEEFVFVAAGAFYGRRELARIINPLQKVLNEQPTWRGHVKLIVAGTIDAEQRAQLENQLPEWVELTGYLSHSEAVRLTATSHCNIIMVPDCQHGRLSIPGKTFELLALPPHILALAPTDSDTARIVQSVGNATVATMEDEAQVAAVMQRIVESHWSNTVVDDRDWQQVNTFDRSAIAKDFADCLGNMCGGRALHHKPTGTVE